MIETNLPPCCPECGAENGKLSLKGRAANALIQQLLTHGPKQKLYDLSVNRLYYALII